MLYEIFKLNKKDIVYSLKSVDSIYSTLCMFELSVRVTPSGLGTFSVKLYINHQMLPPGQETASSANKSKMAIPRRFPQASRRSCFRLKNV